RSWNFYQINTTETNFNADYPGNFGFNADAFDFTLNMFNSSVSAIDHVQIVTVKASDLASGAATLHAFSNDFAGASLRPTTQEDSKAGDPLWFVQQHPLTGSGGLDGDGKNIDVVKMTNVLTSSATFKTTTLAVTPYNEVRNQPPLQPDGSAITGNIDSRIIK